jgi:hypothetical protein
MENNVEDRGDWKKILTQTMKISCECEGWIEMTQNAVQLRTLVLAIVTASGSTAVIHSGYKFKYTSLILMFYDSGIQPGSKRTSKLSEDILGGMRKHLTSIKTKHRNRLNPEPSLILAFTKIRPRIEVLACQEEAHSYH